MNDWREELLYTVDETQGYSFKKIAYHSTEKSDHEHCSICFTKIGDDEHCQCEHIGFFCKETGDWLCASCFDDFKTLFNWSIDATVMK